MTGTAVVHLVRHANGPEPFEAFLRAYERFPAGHEHELVLVFKGFEEHADTHQYLERAADLAPRALHVSDEGFDLSAYMAAATTLDHRRVCFLNSFSCVLAAGWLAALETALDLPRVGVAGATGSWASNRSLGARQVGLPSAYDDVFPDRAALVRTLHAMAGTTPRSALAEWAYAVKMTARNWRAFPPFPGTHLRTNAFLVDRAVFASLRMGAMVTKRDAHRFEGGCDGMTQQLARRSLAAVVVDRHGIARHPQEWCDADVFWQARQEALLVADNQTRAYDEATPQARAVLSGFAWGARARPA